MQQTEKPEKYDQELHADDPYLSNDHVVDPATLEEYEALDQVYELLRSGGFVPVAKTPTDCSRSGPVKRPQIPKLEYKVNPKKDLNLFE